MTVQEINSYIKTHNLPYSFSHHMWNDDGYVDSFWKSPDLYLHSLNYMEELIKNHKQIIHQEN